MRICKRCKNEKSLDQFPVRRSTASGRGPYCLECERLRNKLWYLANRKRTRKPRETPVFTKITAEEWEIRKAASKEKSRQRSRLASRRYWLQVRKPQKEAGRMAKAERELLSDIAAIEENGVKLTKRPFRVCPVLRNVPELYDAARKARKRFMDDPNRNPDRRASLKRAKAIRRTRFKNIRNDLTAVQWEQIKTAYRHRCANCGQKKPLTRDHIVPLSKGGEHTASNIQPLCGSCNSQKGARLPVRAYQPHLIA